MIFMPIPDRLVSELRRTRKHVAVDDAGSDDPNSVLYLNAGQGWLWEITIDFTARVEMRRIHRFRRHSTDDAAEVRVDHADSTKAKDLAVAIRRMLDRRPPRTSTLPIVPTKYRRAAREKQRKTAA